ncbi:uncharacterized protein B0H18DRAFT_950738 [Fomitopsis serialis]|uniref:uncharacterized protein n=1 Tax=Fomitopsis serialis TaxID=139415 RepID=UPI00200858E2|nr:uncharacterized protein B0H18DRAFT_950738 [Neoantrodia serialis]KAH9936466.1 hypothetical protein B0H18DRAFT_950738 [Neoantrodia serialis]
MCIAAKCVVKSLCVILVELGENSTKDAYTHMRTSRQQAREKQLTSNQPDDRRQQLGKLSFATEFSYLKILGHVYVVEDAEDLALIVRDVTRYGGAHKPALTTGGLRSDEKAVDKTMYNLGFKRARLCSGPGAGEQCTQLNAYTPGKMLVGDAMICYVLSPASDDGTGVERQTQRRQSWFFKIFKRDVSTVSGRDLGRTWYSVSRLP